MNNISRDCEDARIAILNALRSDQGDDPQIFEHAQQCASCRGIEEELRGLFEAESAIADSVLPPAVEDRVLRSLKQAQWGRSRWYSRWGLPVAALAGAMALLLMMLAGDFIQRFETTTTPLATMATQAGRAYLNQALVPASLEQAGHPIAAGDIVETQSEARAELKLHVDRVVALQSTKFRLTNLKKSQTRLAVERGALVTEVEPSAKKTPRFFVDLPRAEVTVTGTVFYVRSGAQMDEVAVLRGQVRVVTHTGESLTVSANEIVYIGATGVRRRALSASDSTKIDAALAAQGPIGIQLQQDEPTEAAKPKVTFDEPAESTPRGKVRGRTGSRATPEVGAADRSKLVERGECKAAEDALRAEKRRAQSAAQVVAIAECYLSGGKHDDAIRLFDRVQRDHPRSGAAQNSAYEVARIRREAGDAPAARAAFDSYLERYPRGALAPEARFWICTIDMKGKKSGAALTCLRRYRRDHPQGKRVQETHFLEATVLRALQSNCTEAVRAYDRYLKNPGPNAEQARSWLQWCKQQIAD